MYKRRTRNLFDPNSPEPYKLSRSRLENFMRCPRCFYMDRRLGVDQPSGPPFLINSAVDTLLKREFDGYREAGEPHPYMTSAGIDAVPAQHETLDDWRNNFRGVQHLHGPTNFFVFGAIDDLWVTPSGEYIVVDYKATAKKDPVSLDGFWQQAYKRQIEIYQWLLRRNGLTVSPTAWFVYCNGKVRAPDFGGRVEFDISMLDHVGDDSWVEDRIYDAWKCLNAEAIPVANPDCDFCSYRVEAEKIGA